MRFVIVCDVLGKENNGTTVAAMNLIRALRAKGHEVRIVCPDRDRAGEMAELYQAAGLHLTLTKLGRGTAPR